MVIFHLFYNYKKICKAGLLCNLQCKDSRGMKKWTKSMKGECSEDNPDRENTLSTVAVFMGKEIMYHRKKSCYLIPIHYDPEL
jgi:hypothetical protein